ncbi:carbohydrate ABC transporter permease [Catelliglobosispora koreensis]|uniref:carbohydrate ABC transporter permease n=1 Tax=Catelliglobosispora koreensis TaxID=129052 RepID=UPI000367A978|nr:sugar ABC transporter permease [Catelliglobosispora koreensis]
MVKLKNQLTAYGLMALGIVIFAVFSWYPLARGIVLSFQQWNFITDPEFVGLDNYELIFNDPLFWTAWWNTLKFTLIALALGYVVPFALAVIINEARHAKGFFRTAIYLPLMLPPIVVVILWKYFYDPGNGVLNAALRGVGLPESQWHQGSTTAILSLVIVSTWANMGGAFIMYLAALQNIPGELYEAAEIEGAGIWRRLWHVTIPNMRFIMLVLLLLQVVATMQVFIEPFELTGITNQDTITVMVLIYRYAFVVNQDFGMAAAMSVLLFIVLGVFSALYLRLTRDSE